MPSASIFVKYNCYSFFAKLYLKKEKKKFKEILNKKVKFVKFKEDKSLNLGL